MNGPSTIYRLKPVFQLPQQLDLPSCMYRMKNPIACVTNTTTENFESKTDVLDGIMDKVKDVLKKPLPELEILEERWDSILGQFEDLKSQLAIIRSTVTNICKVSGYPLLDSSTLNELKLIQGAVINASPTNPPYSLLLLKHLYSASLPILISTHVHSSVTELPDSLQCFTSEASDTNNNVLKILIIWKEGISDSELVINPVKQIPIKGEVNILRFLARSGLSLLQYPSEELVDTIQTDSTLDICHRLLHIRTAKERTSLLKNLNAKLGRCSYFGGENIGIADLSAWSILKQLKLNNSQDLTPNLAKWYGKINNIVFDQ